MAIFASSFDAASPLAPWTTSAGVTIVAGRDANGARIATGANLHLSAGLGASIAAGVAYQTNGFANSICALLDTSGTPGGGGATLQHYGDGRLQLIVGSGSGNTSFTLSGFTCNIGVWAYFEVVASIVQIVTPVTLTTSNLQITVSADVYVNNILIGSGSDTRTLLGIANTNIPNGSFNSLGITPPGGGGACLVDDVYVNATRIGDCFVQSDDSTVTVETSAPDVTQALIEVGLIYPPTAPDITQSPIEVGLRPLGFSINCPVCPAIAKVGVPFTCAPPIVTGGTPPNTFKFV